MSRNRKQMGGMSFIVARGAAPEPLVKVEPAWSSRAFGIGFTVGSSVGLALLLGIAALMLRYGADVPLRLAIVPVS